MSYLGW